MADESEFFVAQLFKHIDGEKVTWSFEFEGKTVVLTTRQLMEQRHFRAVVARTVFVFPPRMDRSNFERWVGNLMRNCIEQNNAAPAGEQGRR